MFSLRGQIINVIYVFFVLSVMESPTPVTDQGAELSTSNLVYKTCILDGNPLSMKEIEGLYCPEQIKYYKGHFRAICVRGDPWTKGSLIAHSNGKL